MEGYGREKKDWMEENSIGGRKNGLDVGKKGGRKEKRAKWMRMVWEEGKQGWMEENGMGRRKKGLDGGNCFINKEERGRIENEWRKAVQEKEKGSIIKEGGTKTTLVRGRK